MVYGVKPTLVQCGIIRKDSFVKLECLTKENGEQGGRIHPLFAW